MSYDHTKIERKWQRAWAKNPALSRARDGAKGKKMYVLDMFPYPSGEGLHVGHTEGRWQPIFMRVFAHAGMERASPDGVGRIWLAGGKLCHQA